MGGRKWDLTPPATVPAASPPGKARLAAVVDETHRILGLPDDYRVGIVPGSDTGAFEMAMWTMLGQRPVDVCYWDAFGKVRTHVLHPPPTPSLR